MQELTHDAKELNKRLVSVTGRNSLMLLVDNVRGVFDNAYFADLVTCFNISGKAPYGIGEESRPNDLTYVITSNSANKGSDMASRSFLFYIAPPKKRERDWKARVMRFIDKYRYDILGDIYDILANVASPEDFKTRTRVPEFEVEVLYKMCGSTEVYEQVIEQVLTSRTEANVDDERAVLAVELIKDGIRKELNGEDPDKYAVFIRKAVIDFWLKRQLQIEMQDLRNMVNTGKISCFDPKIKRYPNTSSNNLRASGILFVGDKIPTFTTVKVPILSMSSESHVKVAGYFEDEPLTEAIRERQTERDAAEAARLNTPPTKPGLAEIAAAPEIPYDDTYDGTEDY